MSALVVAALAVLQGEVRGVVHDSAAARALTGAIVQLVSLDAAAGAEGRHTAVSDTAGRFRVSALAPGRYLVGFYHPRLDSVGIDAPVRRVEVRSGRPTVIELATPSTAGIIAAWCGAQGVREGSGVILGFARDPHGGRTWGDAVVAAQWRSIAITSAGARAEVQGTQTAANDRGWYALCGVPRGGVLVLRAHAGVDSSAVLEVEIPEDGVLRRDIAFARDGSRESTVLVRGLVQDADGTPVPGARVRWFGASDEVRADARGHFALAGTNGTALLEVRMVGFVPARQVVDVRRDAMPAVSVALAAFPLDIDTVRVLARRPLRSEELGGFAQRRQSGQGVYLDVETIERRRPLAFTDLLRSIPGVEVRSTDLMTRAVQMTHTSGQEACIPVLVIDGVRAELAGASIDDVVPAELVRAVEIYPRRQQAPVEFQGAQCGSIVVWTGLRGWLARPLTGRRP